MYEIYIFTLENILVNRHEKSIFTSFAVCSTNDINIAYDRINDPQIFNFIMFVSLLINLKLRSNEMVLNSCDIIAEIIIVHE